ncbi:MAG TPA: exosortase [Pyrinomonadaceae bacterium]|nr:exosortase [Pyrinomonadaceae bacterium]
MSVIASTRLWRPLAISAALVFVYGVVLSKLGHDWWTDENYSHGLLIPFIIGYIVWTQRDHFTRAETRTGTVLGFGLVLLALLMLFAGTAGAELFMQRISLVVMLSGLVIFFWGHRLLKVMLVPLGLLLLAIPIPAIIFNKVAFPLQIFASRCAVWSMSLWGIPVLRQGNVIELLPRGARQTRKLEVVEACSGIRSLMTLLTLAVVFAYFTYPTPTDGDDNGKGKFSWLKSYAWWRSVIIVVSAVPIAIFTNAMRVSGTGVLSHYYGTEVADGFFHSFSGWVIYIVAFLMLFAVAWVTDRFRPARYKTSRKADPEVDGAARRQVTASPAIQPEGME